MTTEALIQTLQDLPMGRSLVAIAGPPASGKSTLAKTLAAQLDAPLVPMDGFHLDNGILDARDLRSRKGAPETFDLAGLTRLLKALQAGEGAIAPTFDRTRDLSIAGALDIPASADLILVEGNYLLFDAPGWRDLAALWSFSVWLDVPEPVLERRLIDRWIAHDLSPEAARARAEDNDLPNARRLLAHRLPADRTLTNPYQ